MGVFTPIVMRFQQHKDNIMDRTTAFVLLFAIFAILVGMVSCSEALKPRPAACAEMHS